ncbi:HAD family hydrolase [Alloyangia pacifica]|uniref:Haloacid dehalogenase-like hydrolase n=1 Tax=Alloyangia pacifica TaxID=311180 RepID=A0A1I6WH19_9RHOB|nr:HAD family hydrolase [Alloyangia pacifica]SDI75152.1 haloacid dehalogenase-like hydrolase [Alloyangia pacifica]SFT25288.1 haloacid dehalogenase-like hydrolase [Alloyangia pacifica]
MRLLTATTCLTLLAVAAYADPLPSWNDTEAKSAIIEFVETVTDPASEDFVPQADRIATFDNDGCLWAEQPVYFQLLYAIDVLKEKAGSDPSILTSDALKAGAEGDLEGILAGGMEGLLEVINVSHSGVTVEDFQSSAGAWLESAVHPSTEMPFGEMIYQPMLELLAYLRDEGFATYIVSGGGIDFIRAFAEDTYGIPPWQVVGTEGDTTYAADGDAPTLIKNGGITFLDDKEGKPVGIVRHIGQRPIFAAGNSDGDFQMLEYTTAGDGARFGMLVHHTDADREFAYDRDSHVGQLARGLDEGEDRGWLIVDMAQDWSKVWPGK